MVKDMFGQTVEVGNIVGYVSDNRSVTISRVTRFTPKKVEIVYPVTSFENGSMPIATFSNSLVNSSFLIRLAETPEIQAYLAENKL